MAQPNGWNFAAPKARVHTAGIEVRFDHARVVVVEYIYL
jgi:hypothetical protein